MNIGDYPYQTDLRYQSQNPQRFIMQNSISNQFQNRQKSNNNYFNNSLYSYSSNNNNISNQNTFSSLDSSQSFSISNQFNQILNLIDTKNKENVGNYLNLESMDSNISNQINSINQSIQQLRSQVDNFYSIQINPSLQSVSGQNKSIKSSIETFFTSFHSNHIQVLHKNYSEISNASTIFRDKFETISKNIHKHEFPAIQRSITKLNASLNTLNQRIEQQETKFAHKISQELFQNDSLLNEVNQITKEKLENFQNTTNAELTSISETLMKSIKNYADDQNSLVLLHQSQIEKIHNNVKESLVKSYSVLKKFQQENSEAIPEVSKSIGDALNSNQDENDEKITALNQQYETVFDETEKNLNYLRSEITETIRSIHEHSQKEFASILNIVERNSEVTKTNIDEVKKQINDFYRFFEEENQKNYKKAQETANEIEENGYLYFKNDFKEKIEKKFLPLKNIAKNISQLEKRIQESENSMSESVSQMKINIGESNEKMNDIIKSLDDTRNYQRTRLNSIENEIRKIEVKNNQLLNCDEFSPKNYMEEVKEKKYEEMNKKVLSIENKFNELKIFIQTNKLFEANASPNSNLNENLNNSKVNKSSSTGLLSTDDSDLSTRNHESLNDFDFDLGEEDEEDEEEVSTSTNTLTENVHMNLTKLMELKKQKLFSQNEQQPETPTQWNFSSNSEADDEGTEEFTFNNKPQTDEAVKI